MNRMKYPCHASACTPAPSRVIHCLGRWPVLFRQVWACTPSMACLVTAFLFCFCWWAGELFITHACNERTTSVQWKAIRSRSCKLPPQLGKRQALKPAERQHVKQNKPSTCQLFTNSKPGLSIATEQRSNNVQTHPSEA